MPRTSAPEPITVIILSWNRPLYLWACLDSLYRYTKHPARFILVDNHSDDPSVRKVVSGFERRGMFAAVEWHTTNSHERLTDAVDRHRHGPSEYLGFIESDVAVFDTEPCWLTRMGALMDADPNLGLLGSYIDTRDFVAPAVARRLEPYLDQRILDGLIKAKSPERGLSQIAPETPVIEPFNPPGRLAIFRKDVIEVIRTGSDFGVYRKLKEAGIGTGIATQVRHRHLSLLNFFDYPDYDVIARDEMVAKSDDL